VHRRRNGSGRALRAAVAALLTAACGDSRPSIALPPVPPTTLDDTDLAVIRAVIPSGRWIVRHQTVLETRYIVDDSFQDGGPRDQLARWNPLLKEWGLEKRVLEQLLARNNETFSIGPLSGGDALVVESGALSDVFDNGFWDNFHKVFPDRVGTMRVSAPVYDREQARALIFVASVRGPLEGEGELVLLAREGEGWKIARRLMVWVS